MNGMMGYSIFSMTSDKRNVEVEGGIRTMNEKNIEDILEIFKANGIKCVITGIKKRHNTSTDDLEKECDHQEE